LIEFSGIFRSHNRFKAFVSEATLGRVRCEFLRTKPVGQLTANKYELNLACYNFMGATTHSLEVNAPVGAVYGQWTQFEEFPRFMEGVVEVQRHDAKRLLWKVNIGGMDKEWEAEILEQIPDTRIVWESVDGTQNRGIIAFEPLELDRTLITLTMEYEPEGFLERAGDALGIPSSQVEGNLKRFRDFIERRELENGIGDGQRDDSLTNGNRHSSLLSEEPATEFLPEEAPFTPLATTGEVNSEFHRGAGVLAEDINEPQPIGHSSRLSEESATEFLPEEAPYAPHAKAGEEHSEFYRDAGILSPTREQIAQRAYELYQARGGVHGYAHEDWLEAEKQLTELPVKNTGTTGI
jgi:uncharacterized membrane protein